MTYFFHSIIQALCYFGYRRFLKATNQSTVKQNEIKSTLKNQSLIKELGQNEFTQYEDYQKLFNENINQLIPNIVRLEPTSGSSGPSKWIPYTAEFLNELDGAISPWLFDLYQRFPEIKKGKHYWSLSWLSIEEQKKKATDDLELVSPLKKIFLNKTMLDTKEIYKAKTRESSQYYILIKLLSEKNLSLISIWSPTFLLNLISLLDQQDEKLTQMLRENGWGHYQKDLFEINFPTSNERCEEVLDIIYNKRFEDLWPNLKVISCWTDAQSYYFSKKIVNFFPNVIIQDKGLWATEGVVSFPFKGLKVLAVNSHFLEFYDIEKKIIVPQNELEIGREYNPLITNSAGLKRYNLFDIIKPTQKFNKTFCIDFCGREKVFDIVGEKVSYINAQKIIDAVLEDYKVEAISIGVKIADNELFYYLPISEKVEEPKIKSLELFLEQELCKIHHYNIARQLGQLTHAKIIRVFDPLSYYRDIVKRSISIEGNIKIEPLFLDKY